MSLQRIKSRDIENGEITAVDIKDRSIIGNDLQLATITNAEIAQNTITGGTTGNIGIKTIEDVNIKDGAITSVKIGQNTITGGSTGHLALATITKENIVQNTITGGATGNISIKTITGGTTGNIALTTITKDNIANATITATQIASKTITGGSAGNIALSTIDSNNIKSAGIIGTNIASATIDGTNIKQNTITGGATGNIGLATIDANNIKPGIFGDMYKATYDTDNDGKVDKAQVADSVDWSGIVNKPNTVAGYNIADAVTNDYLTTTLSSYVTNSALNTTLGNYVTTATLNSYATILNTFAPLNNPVFTGTPKIGAKTIATTDQIPTSMAWSAITSKPNTVSGYGITDAVTTTSLTSTLGNYMPISGGVFTGQIQVPAGTNGGIKFPNDAYGGGSDTAGMRLTTKSGEDITLELYTTNDAKDTVNISVPSNDGLTVNGNVVYHAGNFNPVSDSLPQGNYWKIYGEDIATSTATIGSSVGAINSFYLPYPVLFNYFIFVVSTGKAGAYQRVALYDVNGSRVWESGNQSAATTGVMKLTGTGQVLNPGQYFVLFDTNNTGVALLSDGTIGYAVIPQRGTITVTFSTTNPLPATINLSSITMSTQAQPWFVISKY